MRQRLFVYGTLAPGKPNEHVLGASEGTWQEASVRGHLKEQGWGAEMGFPGIVLDDAAGEVAGHLFCSDELADRWAELDDFEGDEYQRVAVRARTAEGWVDAFIYVLKPEQP